MKAYHILALVALATGALVLYGATGSWADLGAGFGTVTLKGTDTPRGNDFVIIGVGLIVCGLVGLASSVRWRFVSGAATLILGGICFFYGNDTKGEISELISEDTPMGVIALVGQGLSLLPIAGIVAAVVGIGIAVVAVRDEEEVPYVFKAPSLQNLNRAPGDPVAGSPEAYFASWKARRSAGDDNSARRSDDVRS